MSGRADTARRIGRGAATAGGAALLVVGVGLGVLIAQGHHARRTIGPRRSSAPYADRRYGRSKGTSRRLVMIGDSAAAGLGADRAQDTIGAVLADLVADYGGQAVVLHTVATVGARSSDLDEQVDRALFYRPHIAVIVIGANDVTHLVPRGVSQRLLGKAVRDLRAAGAQVVVGTCPDLGTVRPIHMPLRWVARHLSRRLSAAQAAAVVAAGGRAVSLGDLLGPEFDSRPEQLFSADRFHPSTDGYRAVAQVLASSVLAAVARGESGEILPERVTPVTLAPLAEAAASAALSPGTELSPAPRPTASSHPGRWARILRRGRPTGTPPPLATPDGGNL